MKATQKLARRTFAEGIAIKGGIGLIGATLRHDLRESFCLPPHIDINAEIPLVLDRLQAEGEGEAIGSHVDDGDVMHLCTWDAAVIGMRRASQRLVRSQLILAILAHCAGKTPGIAGVAIGELTVSTDLMQEAGEATIDECTETELYITPGKTNLANLTPADIRLKP